MNRWMWPERNTHVFPRKCGNAHKRYRIHMTLRHSAKPSGICVKKGGTMSNLSEKFPSRRSHYCAVGGAHQLQGRWIDKSNEYRAKCPDCCEVIYWSADGDEHE